MSFRVLQVVSGMGIGGIETLLINIYRNIDKEKIQFDFVIHRKTEIGYEQEIEELGGRIYYFPNYNIYNFRQYYNFISRFLDAHKEYKIVHIHQRKVSSIWSLICKREKIISIVHSHSTTNGYGLSARLVDILQFGSRFNANYFMGCSYKANCWMFGKKIANSDRCYVLINGIDINSFKFNKERRMKIRASCIIQSEPGKEAGG